MARGVVILLGILAVTGARVFAAPSVAVVHQPVAVVEATPYDPHPQYSYSYSVADGLTGDQKAQEETRNGDVVQGSYSLVEPDGSTRRVSYAADPVNGFNAVVQRDPSVTLETRSVAVAPVYRTAVAAHPVPVVHQPVLAAGSSSVVHQTVVAQDAVGLNVRAGPLYAHQPVLGAVAYATPDIVRVH